MNIDDKNILWLDLFYFLAYGKKIKLLESIKKNENLREQFLKVKKIKDEIKSKEDILKGGNLEEEEIACPILDLGGRLTEERKYVLALLAVYKFGSKKHR